jgi:predicted phage terminase large subunit-like protein
VGIEKGHFKQVLEPFIYKEMQRRNVYFDIREIEHVSIGSKLERVKMLSPLVKAHSIQLPEQSPWLSELECELTGVTKDGFKSLNDDLIDALAMQQQIAQAPVAGRQNRSAIIEEVPASAYHPLSSKYDKEYQGVL